MTTALTKRVAREWLTLIGFLVLGIVLCPSAFWFLTCVVWPTSTVGDPQRTPSLGEMFYGVLMVLVGIGEGGRPVLAWAFVLIPYGVYQLIRSIIWAARTLRTKE
jgi:Na+-transporting NADH:ubiquinone oxidoreductase subunit NqrD